jgi:hypothetical protein
MVEVVGGTVAALGERALIEGYGLAGALVLPAESDADVLRAWAQMPAEVRAVVLTPRAAATLGPALTQPGAPMGVVLP